VGRFIDRRGPRIAVVFIAALFALACGYMGLVHNIVMLLLGFVLVRGLGQGSLSLVSQHVVNLWFVRRRGLAVGLTGLGMAAATAFFPMIIDSLIASYGWREAYALLGLLVAVTILPAGALLFRSRPESFGLVPDGGRAADARSPAAREVDYTLAEARRTRTFWLFVGGNTLVAALTTGLVFHHFSIMAMGGLDRTAAAQVFVPFGIMTAAANLVAGALLDRIPPRYLLAAMLVAQTAALALAAIVAPGLVFVYGGLLGATMGIRGGVQGAVFAHYFGRANLGAVMGTASTIGVVGTAVGPLLFALTEAASGSYAPVLLVSAAASLVLAGVSAALRPFRADGSVA
jgi:MFS transporter, OFA family, oxalate/formate antiporter